ncbi:MAG TPA: single-stranded DNA-binding protein [Burkholderiaceae bacterium]|nr:single-stranded DNA-binding protein [Burkholderiaceae bacterium]
MASLIGHFRLCRDAVLRYTAGDNQPVTNLLLAYNYGAKGSDGKRPTQFVDAELWGKRAEDLAPYLKKGGSVYCVIDDPRTSTYTRSDGTVTPKLSGKVNQIDLGPKRSAELREADA